MFKITNIEIKKNENNESKLLGYAKIVIEECFAIHGIKIINGKEGRLFIAFPSRKVEEGFMDICHPINSETRQLIEDAVLKKFNEE